MEGTATKCKFLGSFENQKAFRVMDISNGNVFNSRSVTFYGIKWLGGICNGYRSTKISSKKIWATKNGNLGPVQQAVMDDTRMDGPYDANGPYVDPEVQDSSYGEPYNLGNTTPRKPKITAINESLQSMLDDYNDRHVNKRSDIPDFALENYDGPVDV